SACSDPVAANRPGTMGREVRPRAALNRRRCEAVRPDEPPCERAPARPRRPGSRGRTDPPRGDPYDGIAAMASDTGPRTAPVPAAMRSDGPRPSPTAPLHAGAPARPTATHRKAPAPVLRIGAPEDRKSTCLNSSHVKSSYAVFF